MAKMLCLSCFSFLRCRERQKKESGGLVSENRRLTSANKALKEENAGLQKKLAQIMCENEDLRNQVLNVCYISSSLIYY